MELSAVNGGFSNNTMAEDYGTMAYYSGRRLADAIVANDFSDQVKYALNDDYLRNARALNATDMKEAKIFLFWLGTNDFNKNVPIEEFKAAILYIIDRIETAYPEASILFMTQIWRTDKDPDIETFVNEEGLRLEDYVNAIVEIFSDPNRPVLDLYHNGPINAENASEYLYDRLHLNEAGQDLIAGALKETLKVMGA
jgi:lysophospholipase L1-like esterase